MQVRRLANAAALLVAAAFLVGAIAYNRSLGSQAEVGKPAPAFDLHDLEGRPVSLVSFRGRPVVVNFWTTWCDPCREEIPGLESFYRRFGERMPLIGVNVREPLSTVRSFVAEFDVTYPVVRDVDGRLSERYRLRGYPESWLIGPDGVARRYWAGPITFDQLEQAYREVMGQPITAGLPHGGPLPAGEPGVGLAVVDGQLLVAGKGRILSAPVSDWQRPEAWGHLPLPGQEAVVDAMAGWPERGRIVAALGSTVWAYEVGSGQWESLGAAPAPVLSLQSGSDGALFAWIRGQGVATVDRAGSLRLLRATGLPLPAEHAWVGELGPWLVAATPAGLLRTVKAAPAFARTRLERPSFAVLEATSEWLVATDRGIYRYDPGRDEATPVPGTPVRTFVALTSLPDGRVAALALDGDLYVFTPDTAMPGSRGGSWEPAPLARVQG